MLLFCGILYEILFKRGKYPDYNLNNDPILLSTEFSPANIVQLGRKNFLNGSTLIEEKYSIFYHFNLGITDIFETDKLFTLCVPVLFSIEVLLQVLF